MEQKTPKDKGFWRRLVAVALVVFVLLSVFVFRLYELQIVHGADYLAQAVQQVSYRFSVPAARGEIVDRYGRPLATNTTAQNLMLNKLFLPDNQLNETLLALTQVLGEQGEEWMDNTPLNRYAPWSFTDTNEDGSDGASALAMKNHFGRQGYATAEQVVAAAVTRYGLEGYSESEQRTLLGLRYEMERIGYSASVPFTFAEGVSEKTVAVVRENTLGLSGVEVQSVPQRVYPDGGAMAHALGVVGLISQEEWTADGYALREAGYGMDETIGKFGLEQAYESRLRGTEGTIEIVREADGTFVSEEMVEEPRAGETIVLTIDIEFQYQLQALLEEYILKMQQQAATADASAGAIVVLDTKTGGVLGYANYPSYDINDYYSSYTKLNTDELQPMLNRAFAQQYRPGSSFKPVVALTGLMTGEITDTSTVSCGGTYTYYAPGYTPGCLGVHGATSVRYALRDSCNIFFYDVGRRVGYDAYNEVAEALGLGVATGLEVFERTGRLTSPETSEALGGEWTAANVIQAAIGQMDTEVTPVQLATYASTLANDGSRLSTHLVQSLRDTATGAETERVEPVVASKLNDDEAFQVVRDGMLLASQQGIYAEYLGASSGWNIPTKTGSPQVTETDTNAVILAYGPMEDPEIAVAIVVEGGANGYRCAELMLQVFEAYFHLSASELVATPENQLLT